MESCYENLLNYTYCEEQREEFNEIEEENNLKSVDNGKISG